MFELEQGSKYIRKKIKGDLKTLNSGLWNYAIKEIHPTIRGISKQGTQHSLTVESNIGDLLIEETNDFTQETAFLLSAAAALHDIGKSDYVKRARISKKGIVDHGILGACVLRTKKMRGLLFNGNSVLCDAVASIVEVHSNGTIEQIKEGRHFLGGTKNVHLQSLASLFRLADMLDTDFDRVPYIFNVVKNNLERIDTDKILEARGLIKGWTIDKENREYIRIIVNELNNPVVKEYVKCLNEQMTESQRLHLAGFYNIVRTRKKTEISLSFPYLFKIAES